MENLTLSMESLTLVLAQGCTVWGSGDRGFGVWGSEMRLRVDGALETHASGLGHGVWGGGDTVWV